MAESISTQISNLMDDSSADIRSAIQEAFNIGSESARQEAEIFYMTRCNDNGPCTCNIRAVEAEAALQRIRELCAVLEASDMFGLRAIGAEFRGKIENG